MKTLYLKFTGSQFKHVGISGKMTSKTLMCPPVNRLVIMIKLSSVHDSDGLKWLILPQTEQAFAQSTLKLLNQSIKEVYSVLYLELVDCKAFCSTQKSCFLKQVATCRASGTRMIDSHLVRAAHHWFGWFGIEAEALIFYHFGFRSFWGLVKFKTCPMKSDPKEDLLDQAEIMKFQSVASPYWSPCDPGRPAWLPDCLLEHIGEAAPCGNHATFVFSPFLCLAFNACHFDFFPRVTCCLKEGFHPGVDILQAQLHLRKRSQGLLDDPPVVFAKSPFPLILITWRHLTEKYPLVESLARTSFPRCWQWSHSWGWSS